MSSCDLYQSFKNLLLRYRNEGQFVSVAVVNITVTGPISSDIMIHDGSDGNATVHAVTPATVAVRKGA